MGKLKVLMLGPGEPTEANSGLGIAASQIAKHLQSHVNLTIIQPGNSQQTALKETYISDIDTHQFADEHITKDVIKINIKGNLQPYNYFSTSTNTTDQEETLLYKSTVIKELDKYTDAVLETTKDIEFDLIYAHDWVTLKAARIIKEKSKKPLVVHIHSLDYDRSSGSAKSWVYQLEKEVLLEADAIISVSDYTHKVLTDHYEISREKIFLAHNAVENDYNNERTHKVFPESLILFVGRLTGQKGPGLFMQIAAKVNSVMPNTRFVMAGTGHMLKELIESGAYRSVSGKFHFTGYVKHEDMAKLYQMSDIYCMPSVSEPFGLSALEAARYNLPVVLSKQSGAAEVLPQALTADYWDIDAFAEHIINLLRHPEAASKIVKLNQKALGQLTWNQTADKVFEVLNKAFSKI